MEIDRRKFIASIGGLAAVEAMDPETRAEALEHYMVEKLDEEATGGLSLAGEEQVVPAAPDATIRRGAGSLFGPSGPPCQRTSPPGPTTGCSMDATGCSGVIEPRKARLAACCSAGRNCQKLCPISSSGRRWKHRQ
jgi:hypothetical protein